MVREDEVRAGAAVVLVLVSIVTLASFGWPFVVPPTDGAEASSHATDAPWLFALVLPLLAALVLAELNASRIDAKAIALLGMLASVGGALRALSPGVAGLEPSFAIIMLGGRVFGRGFGCVAPRTRFACQLPAISTRRRAASGGEPRLSALSNNIVNIFRATRARD